MLIFDIWFFGTKYVTIRVRKQNTYASEWMGFALHFVLVYLIIIVNIKL